MPGRGAGAGTASQMKDWLSPEVAVVQVDHWDPVEQLQFQEAFPVLEA